MKELSAEIRAWIKDVGFPAFVAVYLLVWMRPTFENVTMKLDRIITVLEARK